MSSVEHSTEIAADADQLSVSRSASNSQSAVGLGTVSGRAIQAVGELALRGIETVNIAVTLQRISSRIRASAGQLVSIQDLRDLLELQRIGLYPKSIRRKAWSLLYILLDKECTADILLVVLNWPPVEIQLFLRQLVSHKLTSWTAIPVDSKDGTNKARVSNGVYHIILAVLQHDAYIVHEIYDIYKFARIISPAHTVHPGEETDHRSRNSLTRFFDQWIHLYSTLSIDNVVPLPMRCMIQYLRHGSLSQTHVVADHIKEVIAPFAYLPDDDDDDPTSHMQQKVEEICRQYLSLGVSGLAVLHPTAPFLTFILLLSEHARDSLSAFLDIGLVELIVRLHEIRYYCKEDQPTETIRRMHDLCQAVLDVLSPHTVLQSLTRGPSVYTYPSQSVSRVPSTYASTVPRKQASSDSLSSLRAVFRLKMPPPPPPPSPTLPRAPPPSPSMSFYNLTAESEDTLMTHDVVVQQPSTIFSDSSEEEELLLTPSSPVPTYRSLDSAPSNFYADGADTDCATVGVKTLSSRFPSRRSTMVGRVDSVRDSHSSSWHHRSRLSDGTVAHHGSTSSTSTLGLDITPPRSLGTNSLDRPLPLLPTGAEHDTLYSAETLNGHDADDFELVSLESESYFDEFGSLVHEELSWELKVSKTRRLARRVAGALKVLRSADNVH